MKCVYGPIASWRLGKSLGVDLICRRNKICSFNCIYCQLDPSGLITAEKNTFVPLDQLQEELTSALQQTNPDVITFSGTGEPTLAQNMTEAIPLIRKLSQKPMAILTNSTLFTDLNVQNNLKKLDIIVAKLDAPTPHLFKKINQPAEGITFEQTIEGLHHMRKQFTGKFALQIMFMNNNKKYSDKLADLARSIQPDEIQINTPLRHSNIPPLPKHELDTIQKKFSDMNTIQVYTSIRPKTKPLDKLELLRRRRKEP